MNIISNPDTRIQYAACMIADNWNPESAGSSVSSSAKVVFLNANVRINFQLVHCFYTSVPKSMALIGKPFGLVQKGIKEATYWHFMVKRLTKLAT